LVKLGLVLRDPQMFDKFLEFALLAFQASKRLRPIFVERRGSIRWRVIRIFCALSGNAGEGHGQFWVSIEFGRGNVLVLSTYLVQIMEPFFLKALGLEIGAFEIMAIKSRVHFRRGFHDNGFAKTILLVEPTEPFLGTVRLDKLPYENVDLKEFH
jgi:hypothetical protein